MTPGAARCTTGCMAVPHRSSPLSDKDLVARALQRGPDGHAASRHSPSATARARSRGLAHAPGIWAAGRMFPGDRGLEDAAAVLAERRG